MLTISLSDQRLSQICNEALTELRKDQRDKRGFEDTLANCYIEISKNITTLFPELVNAFGEFPAQLKDPSEFEIERVRFWGTFCLVSVDIQKLGTNAQQKQQLLQMHQKVAVQFFDIVERSTAILVASLNNEKLMGVHRLGLLRHIRRISLLFESCEDFFTNFKTFPDSEKHKIAQSLAHSVDMLKANEVDGLAPQLVDTLKNIVSPKNPMISTKKSRDITDKRPYLFKSNKQSQSNSIPAVTHFVDVFARWPTRRSAVVSTSTNSSTSAMQTANVYQHAANMYTLGRQLKLTESYFEEYVNVLDEFIALSKTELDTNLIDLIIKIGLRVYSKLKSKTDQERKTNQSICAGLDVIITDLLAERALIKGSDAKWQTWTPATAKDRQQFVRLATEVANFNRNLFPHNRQRIYTQTLSTFLEYSCQDMMHIAKSYAEMCDKIEIGAQTVSADDLEHLQIANGWLTLLKAVENNTTLNSSYFLGDTTEYAAEFRSWMLEKAYIEMKGVCQRLMRSIKDPKLLGRDETPFVVYEFLLEKMFFLKEYGEELLNLFIADLVKYHHNQSSTPLTTIIQHAEFLLDFIETLQLQNIKDTEPGIIEIVTDQIKLMTLAQIPAQELAPLQSRLARVIVVSNSELDAIPKLFDKLRGVYLGSWQNRHTSQTPPKQDILELAKKVAGCQDNDQAYAIAINDVLNAYQLAPKSVIYTVHSELVELLRPAFARLARIEFIPTSSFYSRICQSIFEHMWQDIQADANQLPHNNTADVESTPLRVVRRLVQLSNVVPSEATGCGVREFQAENKDFLLQNFTEIVGHLPRVLQETPVIVENPFAHSMVCHGLYGLLVAHHGEIIPSNLQDDCNRLILLCLEYSIPIYGRLITDFVHRQYQSGYYQNFYLIDTFANFLFDHMTFLTPYIVNAYRSREKTNRQASFMMVPNIALGVLLIMIDTHDSRTQRFYQRVTAQLKDLITAVPEATNLVKMKHEFARLPQSENRLILTPSPTKVFFQELSTFFSTQWRTRHQATKTAPSLANVVLEQTQELSGLIAKFNKDTVLADETKLYDKLTSLLRCYAEMSRVELNLALVKNVLHVLKQLEAHQELNPNTDENLPIHQVLIREILDVIYKEISFVYLQFVRDGHAQQLANAASTTNGVTTVTSSATNSTEATRSTADSHESKGTALQARLPYHALAPSHAPFFIRIFDQITSLCISRDDAELNKYLIQNQDAIAKHIDGLRFAAEMYAQYSPNTVAHANLPAYAAAQHRFFLWKALFTVSEAQGIFFLMVDELRKSTSHIVSNASNGALDERQTAILNQNCQFLAEYSARLHKVIVLSLKHAPNQKVDPQFVDAYLIFMLDVLEYCITTNQMAHAEAIFPGVRHFVIALGEHQSLKLCAKRQSQRFESLANKISHQPTAFVTPNGVSYTQTLEELLMPNVSNVDRDILNSLREVANEEDYAKADQRVNTIVTGNNDYFASQLYSLFFKADMYVTVHSEPCMGRTDLSSLMQRYRMFRVIEAICVACDAQIARAADQTTATLFSLQKQRYVALAAEILTSVLVPLLQTLEQTLETPTQEAEPFTTYLAIDHLLRFLIIHGRQINHSVNESFSPQNGSQRALTPAQFLDYGTMLVQTCRYLQQLGDRKRFAIIRMQANEHLTILSKYSKQGLVSALESSYKQLPLEINAQNDVRPLYEQVNILLEQQGGSRFAAKKQDAVELASLGRIASSMSVVRAGVKMNIKFTQVINLMKGVWSSKLSVSNLPLFATTRRVLQIAIQALQLRSATNLVHRLDIAAFSFLLKDLDSVIARIEKVQAAAPIPPAVANIVAAPAVAPAAPAAPAVAPAVAVVLTAPPEEIPTEAAKAESPKAPIRIDSLSHKTNHQEPASATHEQDHLAQVENLKAQHQTALEKQAKQHQASNAAKSNALAQQQEHEIAELKKSQARELSRAQSVHDKALNENRRRQDTQHSAIKKEMVETHLAATKRQQATFQTDRDRATTQHQTRMAALADKQANLNQELDAEGETQEASLKSLKSSQLAEQQALQAKIAQITESLQKLKADNQAKLKADLNLHQQKMAELEKMHSELIEAQRNEIEQAEHAAREQRKLLEAEYLAESRRTTAEQQQYLAVPSARLAAEFQVHHTRLMAELQTTHVQEMNKRIEFEAARKARNQATDAQARAVGTCLFPKLPMIGKSFNLPNGKARDALLILSGFKIEAYIAGQFVLNRLSPIVHIPSEPLILIANINADRLPKEIARSFKQDGNIFTNQEVTLLCHRWLPTKPGPLEQFEKDSLEGLQRLMDTYQLGHHLLTLDGDFYDVDQDSSCEVQAQAPILRAFEATRQTAVPPTTNHGATSANEGFKIGSPN